jgi:hypothetical protein
LLEMRNAHKILSGKPEGKRPLERLRRRWEDNTEMDLREILLQAVDWIQLSHEFCDHDEKLSVFHKNGDISSEPTTHKNNISCIYYVQQWPCGLRRGSWPVGCWDRGFESRSRHECLSLVFLCCVVLCR